MRYTKNGVILPNDFLDGTAQTLVPWLTSDLLKSGEVNGVDKVYSMASVYDPMYTNRF